LTQPELGVLCGLLRAQVTAEKDLTVLRSASVEVYLTDVTFVEYLDRPILGVVCDLLRARVAATKGSVVLTNACVRIYLIHLTFVESQNPDTHCNWRSV